MAQDLFISVQRQSRRLLLSQICTGQVLSRSAHNLQNFIFPQTENTSGCSQNAVSHNVHRLNFFTSLQYFTLFTDYNVSLFADCIILYYSQFAIYNIFLRLQHAAMFIGRSMSQCSQAAVCHNVHRPQYVTMFTGRSIPHCSQAAVRHIIHRPQYSTLFTGRSMSQCSQAAVFHIVHRPQYVTMLTGRSMPQCSQAAVCHNVHRPQYVTMLTGRSMPHCSQAAVCHIVHRPQYARLFTGRSMSQCSQAAVCHNVHRPQYVTLFTGRSIPHCSQAAVCHIIMCFCCSFTQVLQEVTQRYQHSRSIRIRTDKQPAHLATTLFMTMLCFALDTLHKEHSVCRNVFHLILRYTISWLRLLDFRSHI
jgi:hypothetical protein